MTGRAARVAIAALDWQASGEPRPPAEIAALPPREQAQLARAAFETVRAARDAVDRAGLADEMED